MLSYSQAQFLVRASTEPCTNTVTSTLRRADQEEKEEEVQKKKPRVIPRWVKRNDMMLIHTCAHFRIQIHQCSNSSVSPTPIKSVCHHVGHMATTLASIQCTGSHTQRVILHLVCSGCRTQARPHPSEACRATVGFFHAVMAAWQHACHHLLLDHVVCSRLGYRHYSIRRRHPFDVHVAIHVTSQPRACSR